MRGSLVILVCAAGLAAAPLWAQQGVAAIPAAVVTVEFDMSGNPLDPNRTLTCAELRARAPAQTSGNTAEQPPPAECPAAETPTRLVDRSNAEGSYSRPSSASENPASGNRSTFSSTDIAGVRVEREASQRCTETAAGRSCTTSATVVAGGSEASRDAVAEQLDRMMRGDD